jgi:hypothetical protein
LNDVIRNTTEDLLNIAALYCTKEEATRPLPILGGRGAVTGSNQAMPSGVAIQGTKKDAKGGKKSLKQRHQWVARSTSRPSGIVSSGRRGYQHTTLRDSLRRPAQIMRTPSSTSLGTVISTFGKKKFGSYAYYMVREVLIRKVFLERILCTRALHAHELTKFTKIKGA